MKITKKNGNISIYDDEKVVNSILKANEGTDEDYMNKAVAEDIAEDVFNRLTAVTEIITQRCFFAAPMARAGFMSWESLKTTVI
ncbi:MAG: hypothetical protein J6W66_02035 [Lachnospiraceae bacterium]|nr:hypothetical protein [Lachnospiraceae bacterium]